MSTSALSKRPLAFVDPAVDLADSLPQLGLPIAIVGKDWVEGSNQLEIPGVIRKLIFPARYLHT